MDYGQEKGILPYSSLGWGFGVNPAVSPPLSLGGGRRVKDPPTSWGCGQQTPKAMGVWGGDGRNMGGCSWRVPSTHEGHFSSL